MMKQSAISCKPSAAEAYFSAGYEKAKDERRQGFRGIAEIAGLRHYLCKYKFSRNLPSNMYNLGAFGLAAVEQYLL